MEHAHADKVHTPDETLFFEFSCSRCGAVVAVGGRVVLTPDRQKATIACLQCGNEFHLAIVPPTDRLRV